MVDTGKVRFSTLAERLNKEFMKVHAQKPIIQLASDLEDVRAIPCFSPMIGYILGIGGWPEGKLIELFGKEHSGKTSFSYLFLKDCYDFYGGERKVAYIDIEHRFNKRWAIQLGLDPKSVYVATPDDGEQATDIMHELIDQGDTAAVVFDSVGAAAPSHESLRFSDAKTRQGGNAAIMSRNMRTMGPLADNNRTTVIYINQMREDMSGYNQPITPGGRAVKHHTSVRLYLRPAAEKEHFKGVNLSGEKIEVGFPISVKGVKNSFGTQREGTVNFYNQPSPLFNGVGVDAEQDWCRLGLLFGVVERRGPYYYWNNIQVQGRDPFFKKIKDDGLMDVYSSEVQSMFKKDGAVLVENTEPPIEFEGPDVVDEEEGGDGDE